MLCEKCGKNNSESSNICSYCGSEMPTTEMCKGFADILTYSAPETTNISAGYTPTHTINSLEGISEADMKKIIKKTDSIISFSQKNLIVSLISVVLTAIIIICTWFVICSNNKLEESNKNLEKKIDTIMINVKDNSQAINDIINTNKENNTPNKEEASNESVDNNKSEKNDVTGSSDGNETTPDNQPGI